MVVYILVCFFKKTLELIEYFKIGLYIWKSVVYVVCVSTCVLDSMHKP